MSKCVQCLWMHQSSNDDSYGNVVGEVGLIMDSFLKPYAKVTHVLRITILTINVLAEDALRAFVLAVGTP